MAIIGAGVMGARYAAVLADCESAELRAVCDLDEGKAARVAAEHGAPATYADCDTMLASEELDAVVVATPDFAHRAPAEACLAAGTHVLCEKPLATTLEDCEAIAAAVERAGRKFMVSYGNRHRMNAQRIKQILDSGQLGPLKHVYIRLNEKLAKTATIEWLERTSPTWFLLSHCVDTVRWLTGAEFAGLSARAVYGAVQEALGARTPDVVSALAALSGGATVALESAWILPDSYLSPVDFQIELLGAEGCIHADLFPHDLQCSGLEQSGAVDYSAGVLGPLGRLQGWWEESVRYFVDCLESDADPVPSVHDGYAATRVLLAIDEAVDTGGTVTVAPACGQ
ncbi:MAG: Gfo/Idh/MocA family oxidoreductase [Armatimonadota bacterium]|jgi:predicted dehydrogenase